MPRSQKGLDLLARRLILGADENLRTWLGVAQLDRELLGALYLRLREVLERSTTPIDDDTVQELALAFYLTASAWQSKSDAPVDLLVSLRKEISKTLTSDATSVA